MKKDTKQAARTAAKPCKRQCKGSENTIIWRIRQLFLKNKPYTASQINRLAGGNDARKAISNLRKAGWKIEDCRVIGNTKVYWLAELPIDKGRGVVWKWNK